MPGLRTLSKVQLGRETVPGTAVAATSLWRGIAFPEDTREIVVVEESIGLMVPSGRQYVPKLGGQIEFEEIEATFEQLFHLFEAGIKTVGTGASDGVGSGKIYDYTFPTTTPNTIKTYTIEGGDNQQAEEMEYSFVSELKLSGVKGEALKMSATWLGRQITLSTFTGALSAPTVEEILFSLGKLYIDVDSGNFGTTVKSSSLLEMELTLTTGLVPVWTADGALYFTFHKQVQPELELKLTFEHDAVSVAEKTAWRAGTPRLIQLKFEGSTLTTGGTTYQKKTLILNVAGKWESFDALGEEDGDNIVSGTFKGAYSTSKSTMGNFIVVNEIASVP